MFKRLLLLSLFATAFPDSANAGNFFVESSISSQCIIKGFDASESDIAFEAQGYPDNRSQLTIYSNSAKSIFYDVAYVDTNLRMKDGTRLILGKDVFFTKDGKAPLLSQWNQVTGERDPKGNWIETVHIATRKGLTKAMLVPFDKPELTVQIRVRCQKQ